MQASTARDAERDDVPDSSHAGPFAQYPPELDTPVVVRNLRPADDPGEDDDLHITLELDLIDALKGMYFFG